MRKFFILVTISKDRPGIVREVSNFLSDNDANIEDSRMAAMGGRFTLNVLFSCDQEKYTTILDKSATLKELGLEYSFHDAENPKTLERGAALPLKIDIKAMDHVGIVRNVVGVLNKFDVNIESLDTQVTNAPFTGNPIFNMTVTASVPAASSIASIKSELIELADQNNLDIGFVK